MKKFVALSTLALLAGMTALAFAGTTANQTVTYEVAAIDEISVSGSPGAMTVSTATAGSEPTAVTDATTTYSLTTNGSTMKITGALNTDMPANTALKITLTAPTASGASVGQVTLTTTAADLVTGISTVAESGIGISYELSATIDAGIVASASKTVTLTITS